MWAFEWERYMKPAGLAAFVVFFVGASVVAHADEPQGTGYSGDLRSRSTLTGDWGGAK